MLIGSQALVNDPYYNDVVLLLRGYDATSGQVFKDYSKYNRTITANGNVEHSTTQKKYGNSSIYFDGNGDYLSVPSSADFGFGTGDFTVESWVNVSTFTNYGHFATTYDNGANTGDWFFRLNASTQQWQFQLGSGSAETVVISSTNLSVGIWHHLAVTRESGTVKLYQNGTLVGTAVDNRSLVQHPITIGRAINGYDFNGYIDDLRITKGLARYTTNTQPFPNW